MGISKLNIRLPLLALIAAVALAGAGCAAIGGQSSKAESSATQLSGAQEVPPVSTDASGQSTIRIGDDKSVSGKLVLNRIKATAAHIHEGAKGSNGAVILPLTKTSDTTFVVPADAKLTDEQYANYKAGKLYINVHSAAHPGGEIRAQLSPK